MKVKTKKFIIIGAVATALIMIAIAVLIGLSWSESSAASKASTITPEVYTSPKPVPIKIPVKTQSERPKGFTVVGEQLIKDKAHCGALDINAPPSTVENNLQYKIFYQLSETNKAKAEDFILKMQGVNVEEFEKLKLSENKDFDTLKDYWTLPGATFHLIDSDTSEIISKIRERGFLGYLDDLKKEAVKDVIVIIPAKLADKLELVKEGGIILNLVGSADVKVNPILNFEMTLGSVKTTTFRLRSRKIANLFKQKGLYGLHIEFNTELKDYNAEFESFKNFKHSSDSKTIGDLVVVFDKTNFPEIEKSLEKLKTSGLESLVIDEYGHGWANSRPFSVLIASKYEGHLKAFEEKLAEEQRRNLAKCGPNNNLVCDVIDFNFSEPEEAFRVFLAYGKQSELDAFKTKLSGKDKPKLTKATLLKLLKEESELKEFQIGDGLTYRKSKFSDWVNFNIGNEEIVSQTKRKGFKGFVNDLKFKSTWYYPKIYLVVSGGSKDKLGDFRLLKPENIDYKTQGFEAVKITIDESTKITLKIDQEVEHKALVYHIEHLFGRKDLFGLYFELGTTGSSPINREQFESFENYLEAQPNGLANEYDGMVVIHNQPKDLLYSIIDGIRADPVKVYTETNSKPVQFLFISNSFEDLKNNLKFGDYESRTHLKIEADVNPPLACGKDKKLLCGTFEIHTGAKSPDFRFFYAYRKVDEISALKEKIKRLTVKIVEHDKSALYNLLPKDWHKSGTGDKLILRTDIKASDGTSVEFDEDELLARFSGKGFVGFFDDLLQTSVLKDKDFFIMIPTVNDAIKFRVNADIELDKVGRAGLRVTEILRMEKIMDPSEPRFVLRARKIENLFKQEGLYGLHMEFGRSLRDFKDEFVGLNYFIYKDRITADSSRSLTIIHNYLESDVLDALKEIESFGLLKELINRFSRRNAPLPHHSILLVSKTANGLKTFEDKLKAENEEFSGILCGRNNNLICDSVEVDLAEGKYRIFLSYYDKKELTALKKSLATIKPKNKAKLLSLFPESNYYGKLHVSKNFRLNTQEITEQPKRKGFKSFVDEHVASENAFLIVPEDAEDFEKYFLTGPNESDCRITGSEIVQVSEPPIEIVLKQLYRFGLGTYFYKAVIHEISHVFGHKDLHGLHINFGTYAESNSVEKSQFETFDTLMSSHSNLKLANYDKMLVIHDYSYDLVEALDGIKSSAPAEFERQNSYSVGYQINPTHFIIIGKKADVDGFKETLKKNLPAN